MQVGRVADRRDIAGAVPSGAEAVQVGVEGDVARQGETAHLAYMHTNKVDELPGNQWLPFARVVEQLAHGQRRGALLADAGEPLQVLRREEIFQEEELGRLQVFRKLHRVDGLQAFVDIVKQLDFWADCGAHMLDHPKLGAHVVARVEVGSLRRALRFRQLPRLPAVPALLDSDVPVPLLHELAHAVFHSPWVVAARVPVDGRSLPALAAQELIDGHPRLLALEVPQRHVDPREGVVEHRSVPPVAVDHGHLPEFLDARYVAPEDERLQMVLDRRVDGTEPLREGGAPQPVQPGLGGDDLHHHQSAAGGLGEDGLDVLDGGSQWLSPSNTP